MNIENTSYSGEEIVKLENAQFLENEEDIEIKLDDLRNIVGTQYAKSWTAIVSGTLAATIVGFSPIPFSDWILLVPIQMGMIARIMAAYRMKPAPGVIKWLVRTCSSVRGGKFVSSMVKGIPGANFSAMVIDGAFSFVWTLVFGVATSLVIRAMILQGLDVSNFDKTLAKQARKQIRDKLMELRSKSFEELLEYINKNVVEEVALFDPKATEGMSQLKNVMESNLNVGLSSMQKKQKEERL